MSGVVHFKFKSSNAYDSVGFEGAFVSVGELKVLIADKKGLSKDATSELLLSDPRTQNEYNDDSAMVPKSSSVLVRRVPNLPPAQLQQQQQQPPPASMSATASKAIVVVSSNAAEEPSTAGEDDFGVDLYSEQRDEDAALTQLLAQQGQDWEKEVKSSTARGRGRGRGRDMLGRGFGRGRGREAEPAVLPKGYICYRCGQQGHHISECPTNNDPDFKRIRPAVGVPSVLLTKDKGGGLLLPDGTTGSLQPNENAFLKETVGMPGAKAANGSASKNADSKHGEADKAMVVYSEAGPALAGGSDMPLPMDAPGLLLPPGGGMMFGEAAAPLPPFLPGMPLPGMDMPGDKPLSKEEFLRMKEEMRRRTDSSRRRSPSRSPSRSRSRSRNSDRRRRSRDSRSPRRRDSPRRGHRHRRHRSSRDRSSSREPRPYYPPRRRSPAPGFIQLRKRSRSPQSRRGRQSSPIALQGRARASASPPRRRPRQIATERWHPEGLDAAPIRHSNLQPAPGTDLDTDDPEFSTSFDPKPDQQGFVAGRQAPSQRLGLRPGLASRLSVPELLDESGPFFDDSADQPTPKARKDASAFSRLGGRGATEPAAIKERKGLQAVAMSEAQPKAKRARNTDHDPKTRALPPKESEPLEAKPDSLEDQKGIELLPKTFSIPVEEERKEKKQKKSKKSRDKDRTNKEHKHRQESAIEQQADPGQPEIAKLNLDPSTRSPLTEPDREPAQGVETAPKIGQQATERRSRGALFEKAMTDASPRKPAAISKGDAAEAAAVTNGKEAQNVFDASAAMQGAAESDDDRRKRKKEHKHKHKSKKSKKVKHTKEDQ